MGKELLLLRHAKSSWDSGVKRDFDRPLNKRGQRNAPRMGRWLREHDLLPDYVASSPATRAKLTILAVLEQISWPPGRIVFDESLYLGDRDDLLRVVSRFPVDCRCGLLVGHNPGLEELLMYLCGDIAARTQDGKILVTAAIARISIAGEWASLRPGHCHLVEVARPKELD